MSDDPQDDPLEEVLRELVLSQGDEAVLKTHVDKFTPEFFYYLGQLVNQLRSQSEVANAIRLNNLAIQAAVVAGERANIYGFLELSGHLAMDRDLQEEAITAFESARELAEEHLEDGYTRALVRYVSNTTALADREAARENFARAREVLSEARLKSHQLNSAWGELWTTINLAAICTRQGEFEQSLKYALLLPDLMKAFSAGGKNEVDQRVPPLSETWGVLFRLAYEFYYQKDDYKNASVAAKQAIQIDPTQEGAYELLGFSQLRLKQLDDGVETWAKVVKLNPEKSSHQFNYSAALWMSNRPEEALVPVGEAIRISPSNPRYYLHRSQILTALDRHEDAIDDLKQIIEIAKTGVEEPTQPNEPSSHVEWERNMSAQDMVYLAMTGMVQSYRKLSKVDEARQTIKQMLEHERDYVNALGYNLLGRLEQELGNSTEALAAYGKLLELRPDDNSVRDERINIYLALGEVENTLLDLSILARKENEPEKTVQKLTAILNEHPECHSARKWLGFAYLENFRPAKARETLDEAIAHFPDDAELYLWRGLAKIMFGGHLEPEWDKEFDLKRLIEAIGDLGDAIRLAPDNVQAVEAYKWLVDRVTADPVLLQWMLISGDQPNGLFSILPETEAPFKEFWTAVDMGSRRHWAEAVERLKPVQTTLAQIGFPAVANRIDMHLADNYVRLYDLQKALDHITRAERYHSVLVQPLTGNLKALAQEKSEQALKQSFSEFASVELEYLSIYGIGFKFFMDLVRLMKADILSRLNDPRAVEVLGDVNEFISDVKKTLTSGISYRALTGMVMILRDDGQYDKAIEVLNKIEPFATTDQDRLFLYNTAGTLYELIGDTDKAMSYFQQTYDLALTKGEEFLAGLSMNMASNHIHQGRSEKALELLSSVDIKKDAKSEKEVYGYNLLMAQALAGLDRYAEAQTYVLEALSVIEQARLKLRSFESRMNWQGEQESVYRFAVAVAVTNDDRMTAFDLMERSRARAFVDQLAAGHLALPESKKHLAEIEQRLLTQQALLNKLANYVESQNANFVDYELLAKLNTLNESLQVFEEQEGDDKPARLSAAKIEDQLTKIAAALTRVDREIEEARLLNATNTYGAVLTFSELRDVLSN